MNDKTEKKQIEMLVTNERQRLFYETPPEQRGNLVLQLWRKGRLKLQLFRNEIGVTELIDQRHWQWMGNLEGKRVLDLGCYAGNRLSLDIAQRCGFYLGIDLSEPAIAQLRSKISHLSHAHAETVDFLAPEFPYEPFDIIYAHGVMHHFKYFDTFLKVLHQRLVPDGKVISFDPMQTSWPIWLARKMYRPFQSDKDWEWPFSRTTFQEIEKYFHIEGIQGVFGYSKWALPMTLLPFGSGPANSLGKRLHERDVRFATQQGRELWQCMQVALCLRRQHL